MLLAIETAGVACSTALIEAGRVVDERHELVGRGHAERLMPMIADLLGNRRPDSIAVDCGPGSFTGIRVGIAAARGLGLGWGLPVSGFSSTALLAVSAFASHTADTVAVAIAGGHGQVFFERFTRSPFRSLAPLASLFPAEAAALCAEDSLIAGSGAAAVTAAGIPERAGAIALDGRAADVRLLLGEEARLPPRPIYGRAPDAKAAHG